MTAPRKYAEIAAAALAKMLKASTELGKGADIVGSVLAEATREREEVGSRDAQPAHKNHSQVKTANSGNRITPDHSM